MLTGSNLKRNLCILLSVGGIAAHAIHGHAANASAVAPPKDRTPPAAVADLTIFAVTSNTITVRWSATGDDGMSGTASAYDIRYSSDGTITEQNWDVAFQAFAEPVPAAPTIGQSYDLTGLSQDTTYYMAMKVRDDGNNWSGLSTGPGGFDVSALTPAASTGDWVFEVIDSESMTGGYHALAYDPDTGHPSIAYFASGSGQNDIYLKYARFDGSSWTIETVDIARYDVDLAFNPNTGQPTIAYLFDGALKFAEYDGNSWQITVIEEDGASLHKVSLAYDTDTTAGQPSIVYAHAGSGRGRRRTSGGVKIARRDAAGSWSKTIAVPDESAGHISLAFDSSGNPPNPSIAYRSVQELRFVCYQNGSGWGIPELVQSGGWTGGDASLAYDPITDAPSIVHWGPDDNTFEFARKVDGAWAHEYPDACYGCDMGLSMVYDSAGTAFVSYYQAGGPLLKLATRSAAGSWQIEIVQDNVYVFGDHSLKLDPNGNPAFIYFDNTNDDLKFVHKP